MKPVAETALALTTKSFEQAHCHLPLALYLPRYLAATILLHTKTFSNSFCLKKQTHTASFPLAAQAESRSEEDQEVRAYMLTFVNRRLRHSMIEFWRYAKSSRGLV